MITWMIISNIIPITISALYIKFNINTNDISFFYKELLQILIFSIIVDIMYLGAMMIAKALSGSSFLNVLLTLLVLFGPGLLTYLIFATIDKFSPIIPTSAIIPVPDKNYNMLTAIIFDGFTPSEMTSGMIVYSVLLGILYYVIAFFLFKMRPSETAGKSFINKYIQQGTFIFIALLIGTNSAFYMIPNVLKNNFSNLPYIILAYISSFLLIVLFSLLSDKSKTSLKRSLKSIVITFVLDIFVILSIIGILKIHENHKIKADDIEAITIYHSGSSTVLYNYPSITNKELNKSIANIYEYTLDNCFSLNDTAPLNTNSTIGITINNKLVNVDLLISEEEMSLIEKTFLESEEFLDNIDTIPEKVTTSDIFFFTYYANQQLRSNSDSLYKCIYDEYTQLTLEEKLEINTAFLPSSFISLSINKEPYPIKFAVMPKYFPNTYREIFECTKKENEANYSNLVKILNMKNSSITSLKVFNLNTNAEKDLSDNAMDIVSNISKENLHYSSINNVYILSITIDTSNKYYNTYYFLLVSTEEPLF